MVRVSLQSVFVLVILLAGSSFAEVAAFDSTFEEIADREFTANLHISSARVADAAKDSIVGVYTISGRKDAYLNVYRVSSPQVLLVSSKSFNIYTNYTYPYAVTNPAPGQIWVGGYYAPFVTKTSPYLVSALFSGGSLGTPAMQNLFGFSLPADDRRAIEQLDMGDMNGDGTKDAALLFSESFNGQSYAAMRACLALNTGATPCIFIPTMSASTMMKLGKYTGENAQVALAGWDSFNHQTLKLLVYRNGAIQDVAANSIPAQNGFMYIIHSIDNADLDGDGTDELIIGGVYAASEAGGSDFVRVYRYSGDTYAPDTGWELKAEYLNASQSGISFAKFVGTADVDSDGKPEIAAVSSLMERGGSYRIKISTYKYDGTSQLQLLSVDEIKPANPSADNYYRFSSAATGDYLGDGRGQVAVVYEDNAGNINRMGVYKITVQGTAPPAADTEAPAVSILSPTQNSFVNAGQLSVRIKATDSPGGNLRVRARLTGPGNYNTGYFDAVAAGGNVYTVSFSIAGLAPGVYTITAGASDAAGNRGSAEKIITLTLPAAPAAPDGMPPVVAIITPAEGATVASGVLSVKVSATDGTGVQSVTMLLSKLGGGFSSGFLPASLGADGFYYLDIDMGNLAAGGYTIQAAARDAAGNQAIDANAITLAAAQPAGNRDAHGCVPSAGESWCEALGKCLAPAEECAAPPQQPAAGAQEAEEQIAELELKIAIAAERNVATPEMSESLGKAKLYQQEGRYTEAVTEAKKGMEEADAALGKFAEEQNRGITLPGGLKIPCPGALAAIGLTGLFVLYEKKK